MLRFEVHDVGHGFCATLSGDGYFTVFDCGHKDYPENRPSKFLPARSCRTINEFVIGNFDQDHVSDLPDLRAAVHIDSIMRNLNPPEFTGGSHERTKHQEPNSRRLQLRTGPSARRII